MQETETDVLKRRIEACFGGRPVPETLEPRGSDYDLNPHVARRSGRRAALKKAAVLVPIVERPEGLTLLLTVRTPHLEMHAGQIAFPGGGAEPQDPSLTATALRETEEEVGIRAQEVRIVGAMDPYETRTGYLVTPIVAFVAPDYTRDIDAFEVAEIFEVPLGFILDSAHHERHTWEHDGVCYQFYAIPYGDYYIWGATAGMLMNFYRALEE